MNNLMSKSVLSTTIIIAMGLAMVATHKLAGTGYSTTAAIFVPLAAITLVAVLLTPWYLATSGSRRAGRANPRS